MPADDTRDVFIMATEMDTIPCGGTLLGTDESGRPHPSFLYPIHTGSATRAYDPQTSSWSEGELAAALAHEEVHALLGANPVCDSNFEWNDNPDDPQALMHVLDRNDLMRADPFTDLRVARLCHLAPSPMLQHSRSDGVCSSGLFASDLLERELRPRLVHDIGVDLCRNRTPVGLARPKLTSHTAALLRNSKLLRRALGVLALLAISAESCSSDPLSSTEPSSMETWVLSAEDDEGSLHENNLVLAAESMLPIMDEWMAWQTTGRTLLHEPAVERTSLPIAAMEKIQQHESKDRLMDALLHELDPLLSENELPDVVIVGSTVSAEVGCAFTSYTERFDGRYPIFLFPMRTDQDSSCGFDYETNTWQPPKLAAITVHERLHALLGKQTLCGNDPDASLHDRGHILDDEFDILYPHTNEIRFMHLGRRYYDHTDETCPDLYDSSGLSAPPAPPPSPEPVAARGGLQLP